MLDKHSCSDKDQKYAADELGPIFIFVSKMSSGLHSDYAEQICDKGYDSGGYPDVAATVRFCHRH